MTVPNTDGINPGLFAITSIWMVRGFMRESGKENFHVERSWEKNDNFFIVIIAECSLFPSFHVHVLQIHAPTSELKTAT